MRTITELSPERREQLIGELAAKIAHWGLITPAILFLEVNRPFSFIGSQALLLFQPLLSPLLGNKVVEYAQLFEDRASVERLLQRLEKGVGNS
ncbi:MAG: hypothetical protein WBW48_01695 [Anaerolineae bacterium]